MSEAIETKFYRMNDGRPARARILPQMHSEDCNPRVDQVNGSVMITFGWDFHSPDKISQVPQPLDSIVSQWTGNTYRSSNGIRADLVRRWASIFAPGEVIYVGALYRGYNGELTVGDPTEGIENHGIVMVTRATLREGWGTEFEMTAAEAEALAKAEAREYSDWAASEVYGYAIDVPAFPGADIDHDGKDLEDCWGYIGESGIEAIRETIAHSMLDQAKEITEAQFDGIVDVANGRHREAVRHLTWN